MSNPTITALVCRTWFAPLLGVVVAACGSSGVSSKAEGGDVKLEGGSTGDDELRRRNRGGAPATNGGASGMNGTASGGTSPNGGTSSNGGTSPNGGVAASAGGVAGAQLVGGATSAGRGGTSNTGGARTSGGATTTTTGGTNVGGSASTGGSVSTGGSAGASSAEKAGYTLVFQDEFTTGTVPNKQVYSYHYTWGDETNPAGDAAFLQGDTVTTGRGGNVDDAQTISGGLLKLTATKATARYGGLDFPYRTGMVRLKAAQRYGYFEIRAKLPRGAGLWPAFWLMPEEYDDTAIWEIDVLEAPSSAQSSIYMNLHWGSGFNTAGHQQSLSSFAGDFTTGFHTFGLSWEANAVVWYIDGIERKRQTATASISPVPMQVICNLAVGGSWPGSPDASTPFPAVYEIDYIRVYRKQ